MKEFILRIIPIIIFFALGCLFRQFRIFKKEDGSVFLNLVFYLCMPALTFSSLLETELNARLLYIPLLPVAVMLFTYVLSRFVLLVKPQNKKTTGTFLIASMIMNTGFTLPFFYAGFGNDGFAKAILFDIGNSFLIFTWVYFIAVKAAAVEGHSKLKMLTKTILLPPLWALVIALILKQSQIAMPNPVLSFFKIAGEPTIPLIMIALGLYFEPSLKYISKSLTVISIRMLGGLLIGLLLMKLIPFDHVTKIVVIASSAAPVGYNSLVFSSMEELDVPFAATTVSLSILSGIFYIPLLFFIFGN
ncbi:MAG TPA: AEC family transporter [Candidatus Cloacimonadota bacterium]|nr:AEC family transporter [Candidatus Cloacimonadota bacterium]HOD54907.1 AEC family transporter [Candidatus Cloacimonadota bacterium]